MVKTEPVEVILPDGIYDILQRHGDEWEDNSNIATFEVINRTETIRIWGGNKSTVKDIKELSERLPFNEAIKNIMELYSDEYTHIVQIPDEDLED